MGCRAKNVTRVQRSAIQRGTVTTWPRRTPMEKFLRSEFYCLETRLSEKRSAFANTCKLSSEELDGILYEGAQLFESKLKIQNGKNSIAEVYPEVRYQSQADLIWPESPFKCAIFSPFRRHCGDLR